MKFDRKEWLLVAAVALMFACAFYAYPSLPDQIPTHWNAAGEPDDFGSPESIFMLPVVSAFVYGLLFIIPYIETRAYKKNVEEFYKQFGFLLKLSFILLMWLVFLAMLLNAHENKINMSQPMIAGVAMLFLFIGYAIRHVKTNYFIGIRTPWTLSNEKVWKQTHEFGGKAMMASALLMIVGALLLPPSSMSYLIMLAAGIALLAYPYSYLAYRKIEGRPRHRKSQ